jgi:putative transposase
LRHAVLPKTLAPPALKTITVEGSWPSYGLPWALVCDNGLEFHGVDIEAIAMDLGMTLVYCPKRQPRFKGTIERFLKTINYYFAHQLPGTSFARFHQRGDYDPDKQALLTFGEFRHIFEKWLVDVYAQTVHRGIGTTPFQRWMESAAVYEPKLPDSVQMLQRRIGQHVERKLRRTGLELYGIRYNSDELNAIVRRYGEGVSARVVFDPDDLGEVQIWGPGDADPIGVRALNFEYARGLTVRQHELIREKQREDGAGAQDMVALQRAREQIAASVQELMISRKLRARRRSATIRGISSTKPGTDIPPAPLRTTVDGIEHQATEVRPLKKPVIGEPLPLLTAFEMPPLPRPDDED